jgi:hypothetical protein
LGGILETTVSDIFFLGWPRFPPIWMEKFKKLSGNIFKLHGKALQSLESYQATHESLTPKEIKIQKTPKRVEKERTC